MATTVITGRDVTFTLDAASYDAQVTSAVLSNEHTIEVFQTLDGRAYKALDDQWTFTVELLQTGAQPHLSSKQCGQIAKQLQTQHLQFHSQPLPVQFSPSMCFQCSQAQAEQLQERKPTPGQ